MHDSIRLLIAIAFLLPGAASMADLETGLAAYMEGDYETALNECQPLAEDGNVLDGHFQVQDFLSREQKAKKRRGGRQVRQKIPEAGLHEGPLS